MELEARRGDGKASGANERAGILGTIENTGKCKLILDMNKSTIALFTVLLHATRHPSRRPINSSVCQDVPSNYRFVGTSASRLAYGGHPHLRVQTPRGLPIFPRRCLESSGRMPISRKP